MMGGHADDSDLLLRAHGALPPLRRVRVEAHLRRCPACRRRLQELTRVSTALAAGIRDPGQLPWRAPSPPGSSVRWRRAAVLVLLMLTVLLVGVVRRNALTHKHPMTGTFDSGCRPDLPDDRCR